MIWDYSTSEAIEENLCTVSVAAVVCHHGTCSSTPEKGTGTGTTSWDKGSHQSQRETQETPRESRAQTQGILTLKNLNSKNSNSYVPAQIQLTYHMCLFKEFCDQLMSIYLRLSLQSQESVITDSPNTI